MLFTHIICTAMLTWIKSNLVQITSTSNIDHSNAVNVYDGVVSAGLAILILQIFFVAHSICASLYVACVHIFTDIAGSFFILWMILDGSESGTYVVIFVSCV